MIPASVYERTLRGFLEPVRELLDDPRVTEILINSPDEIFVERRGKLRPVEARFPSELALVSALRVVAQYVGRAFDEENPILEARLPDGSRLEALLPPIASAGPTVAIRRFSKDTLSCEKLLELGALTEDALEFLRGAVACKRNLVVAGGTGSGKTSLLNALSALVPEDERVIVIEDARELQLQREHVVQLETRPPDPRGRFAVTIRDLFKASLRMRPDRIVLGEIRGGEALDLIQAMTSGHGGCLTTVHATYPRDTLHRLETLALLGGVEIPLFALRSQLVSAVDLVVQTARLRDGRRLVTHVTEVSGLDAAGTYQLKDLFRLSEDRLEATGERPECRELLETHGYRLPEAMLAARREPT